MKIKYKTYLAILAPEVSLEQEIKSLRKICSLDNCLTGKSFSNTWLTDDISAAIPLPSSCGWFTNTFGIRNIISYLILPLLQFTYIFSSWFNNPHISFFWVPRGNDISWSKATTIRSIHWYLFYSVKATSQWEELLWFWLGPIMDSKFVINSNPQSYLSMVA